MKPMASNINLDYPTDMNPGNPAVPVTLGVSNHLPPNNSSNELLLKILEKQKEEKDERKIHEYEKEIARLKEKNMDKEFEKLRDMMLMQASSKQGNININNNTNTNTNVNQNQVVSGVAVAPVVYSDRLEINGFSWCLILILNLFLGGVGTIIAGVKYGHTAVNKKDRKGDLVCRGLGQIALVLLCCVGNIWGVIDAIYSFESGHCL